MREKQPDTLKANQFLDKLAERVLNAPVMPLFRTLEPMTKHDVLANVANTIKDSELKASLDIWLKLERKSQKQKQ